VTLNTHANSTILRRMQQLTHWRLGRRVCGLAGVYSIASQLLWPPRFHLVYWWEWLDSGCPSPWSSWEFLTKGSVSWRVASPFERSACHHSPRRGTTIWHRPLASWTPHRLIVGHGICACHRLCYMTKGQSRMSSGQTRISPSEQADPVRGNVNEYKFLWV
jgi:hypothetical protein